jgi:hypothetical protein
LKAENDEKAAQEAAQEAKSTANPAKAIED